jgi:hypothetical protein
MDSLYIAIIVIVVTILLFAFIRIKSNGGKNIHFPDLAGKVIIITGANQGIGFATAQELQKLNP